MENKQYKQRRFKPVVNAQPLRGSYDTEGQSEDEEEEKEEE